MSEEVVLYQAAIAISIIAASILIGARGMLVVAAIAVIWTIVMVFTKWLFVLQFFTIAASMLFGLMIFTSDRFKSIRNGAWRLIGVGAALVFWYLWRYYDSEAPQQPLAVVSQPASPSTKAAPPVASPAAAKIDDRLQMKATVAYLERSYPELDENAKRFNQAVTDRVLDRQKQLIDQAGLLPSTALMQASEEVMKKYNQLSPDDEGNIQCVSKNGSHYPRPCKYGESFLTDRRR